MIYWISVFHMRPEVIKSAFSQIREMTTDAERARIDRMVFVDHHYPVRKAECSKLVEELGRYWKAEIYSPLTNLGGHGGVSFALNYLKPTSNDLVFVVDPDSFPTSQGWVTACLDAFAEDNKKPFQSLGSVSLTDERLTHWDWPRYLEPQRSGPRLAFLPRAEMINMSVWRASVLKKGFLANSQFYGHMETAMWAEEQRKGMRHAYLVDYKERTNPIPHDEIYTAWKHDHARGDYPGNFDQYVKEKSA